MRCGVEEQRRARAAPRWTPERCRGLSRIHGDARFAPSERLRTDATVAPRPLDARVERRGPRGGTRVVDAIDAGRRVEYAIERRRPAAPAHRDPRAGRAAAEPPAAAATHAYKIKDGPHDRRRQEEDAAEDLPHEEGALQPQGADEARESRRPRRRSSCRT